MTDRKRKQDPHPFLQSVLVRSMILYILLFSSAITLIGTSVQLYFDYTRDRAAIRMTFDQIKTSHLRSVVNNLWVADREMITVHLREILSLPDIQSVWISADGAEKFSFGTRKSTNRMSREYPLIYSFRNREVSLGTLHIEATLDKVFKRLRSRAVGILLTQGIQIFLVALFIAILFHWLVGRHLRTMADYARGLDLQNMDRPIRLSRPAREQQDELDMVAAALNYMRTSLLADITRRRKTEEEIVRRKAVFEAMINAISDAVVFVDSGRRIKTINPAFIRMFGYQFDEVAGKTTEFFYADPEGHRDQGKQRYHKGAVVEQSVYEMEYRRKDGSVFPADTLGGHVKSPDGEVLGFIGVIRDISGRKEVEAELAQYRDRLEQGIAAKTDELRATQEQLGRKEKLAFVGQLAATVRHDLRNPLGVIANSVYFLGQKLADADDKVKKHIHILQDQAHNMERIIGDLLDFSKAMEPDRQEWNLNDLVTESLASLDVRENIIVAVDLGRIDSVWVDRVLMLRAFNNLFANAFDAMPDGGELNISAEKDDAFWRMDIRDTGGGISPDDTQKIFEPLYTTKPKGFGLGLVSVKAIIENHGGAITVASEIGRGATFTLRLPITTK